MGDILNYFNELTRSMEYLSQNEKVIFLGQCVGCPGNALFKTMPNIDTCRKLELPVIEDTQMGMSIGLSFSGFIPVTVYPRWNFLALATNQLANHLDKFTEMTVGRVEPKVIVRVCVGSTKPLHPGVQHCSDFTDAYKVLLNNIDVIRIEEPEQVFPAYEKALHSDRSSIIVEVADYYGKGEDDA